MQIRPATPFDAPAIRALIDQYVASGTLLPRSETFIASHCHNFLVADARGVVGCVHLDEYSPSLAELRSLAVARRRRAPGWDARSWPAPSGSPGAAATPPSSR
jgi:amino-acid N-acetyltransferase